MFVDAHAHLYDGDPKSIVQNAKERLVQKIICASSDVESMQKAVAISDEFDEVFATIGIHPQDAESFDENAISLMKKLAKHPKVVAVGEIGLDYHYDGPAPEKQKSVFLAQLSLAREFGLPVQIHIRDAMEDALQILEQNRALLANGGVVHCFGGSLDDAKRIIALGLDFTIGGVCTFKNAKPLQETIKSLPLEKIMLETDSPYLAPEPVRGSINESKNIPFIAEKIAALKGVSVEEVARKTSENVKRVFKI